MTALPPPTAALVDVIDLTQILLQCPSITPQVAGCWDVITPILTDLGFTTEIMSFGGDADDSEAKIENLVAQIKGSGKAQNPKKFAFCGHIDVVPAGNEAAWSHPPFAAHTEQGRIFGRGAVDMKGAVACFIAAISRFLDEKPDFMGAISIILTADEEGPAVNGIAKVFPALAARGDTPSVCLVGEPTNTQKLGDMMKIGRRGSLNGVLTVTGIQGHVAYPHRADNPLPKLLKLLDCLGSGAMDEGTKHFPPSNLELTSIDCGNHTANLIPAEVTARFNLRFNDGRRGNEWEKFLRARLDQAAIEYELNCVIGGEAFITQPGAFSNVIAHVVTKVTGNTPDASTTGGTSDARFIAPFCPVVEFGLVGESMHKIDESVRIEDLHALTEIYYRILWQYFQD
ncbi:MAG: succinyl-diaminopimelate desuccinylase [Alphaproteobacteria bacterium]|nr:succinyl-diaminopimelate desuccinylase [Alphaproteobacteria bacterium]